MLPDEATEMVRLAEAFLAQQDIAPSSKRIYRRSILRFANWMLGHPGDLRARAIEWRDSIEGKPRTVRLYVAAIRCFFGWCVANGAAPFNPFDAIKVRAPRETHVQQVLSLPEVHQLLEHTLSDGREIDLRDHAIMTLMLHTGLRVSSVAMNRIEDFQDRDEVIILWYGGKNVAEKSAYVLVVSPVLRAINEYMLATHRRLDAPITGPLWLVAGGDGQLTLAGLQKMIVRRMMRAGLKRPGISPHALRHTAASIASANGADPQMIKAMLGHSRIETTQIYIHDVNRLQRGAELFIDYGLGGE